MRKIMMLSLAVICVFSLLVGCGNSENQEKDIIKVGSKSFTENLIVSELYALALEDKGYKIERVPNIAGSLIHTAILNREIDLFPEYTGTGLIAILKTFVLPLRGLLIKEMMAYWVWKKFMVSFHGKALQYLTIV